MAYGLTDVTVYFDDMDAGYIDSISVEMQDDSGFKATNKGDLPYNGNNTGGTISISGYEYPETVAELKAFQDKLDSKSIESCTFSAYGVAKNGEKYLQKITCIGGTILAGYEWSPSDDLGLSFDCKFREIKRTIEKI